MSLQYIFRGSFHTIRRQNTPHVFVLPGCTSHRWCRSESDWYFSFEAFNGSDGAHGVDIFVRMLIEISHMRQTRTRRRHAYRNVVEGLLSRRNVCLLLEGWTGCVYHRPVIPYDIALAPAVLYATHIERLASARLCKRISYNQAILAATHRART